MPVILQYGEAPAPGSFMDLVTAPGDRDMLMIVPTRRKVRQITRELLISTGQTAAVAPQLTTLDGLVRKTFLASPYARRVLVGPFLSLLLHDAVRARAGDLEHFVVYGREPQLAPGIFAMLQAVILHLEESGVDPDTLSNETAAAPPDEQRKLHDVAAIYAGYLEALAAANAVDPWGPYTLLHLRSTQRQFDVAFRRVFPDAKHVLLVGFDEFTLPEMGFLRKLRTVPGVTMRLVLDFREGNPDLFGHLEQFYQRFLDLGFTEMPVRAEDAAMLRSPLAPPLAHSASSAHDHFALTLFGPALAAAEKPDCSSTITLRPAPNKAAEVVMICRLIKQLVADRPDRDLSRICVAMRFPQLYADIMREEFVRYGIPANITDRYDLARSPLVADILGLLRVRIHGFRPEDVLRLARSPYFSPGPAGSPVDAANLERAAHRIHLRGGGVKRWIDALEHEYRAPGTPLTSEELGRARADLLRIDEITRPLHSDLPADEFRQTLLQLLRDLQLPVHLVEVSPAVDSHLTEKDVRAFRAFLKVLDQTTDMMKYHHGPLAPHPPEVYLEELTVALSGERYNVREQFGRGVLVTSIEETRGLPIEVMILAGLEDGKFPSAYQPEVFFSGERQKTREQHHVWRDRYLFYQGITNWSEHLYLTYPEREADVDVVRSPFVDAILNVATIGQPSRADAVIQEGSLYSRDELLRWYAGHLSFPAQNLPADVAPAAEEVRKALAVDESRRRTHVLAHYEGDLREMLPPEAREELAGLRNNVFSVSQVEAYLRCPMQFFFSDVLHIEPLSEISEESSTRERGAALHAALFEFYARRSQRQVPLLRETTDRQFEEAVSELTALVAEKLEEVETADPLWMLERDILTGGAESGGLLREFLRVERGRTDQATPAHFEVRFGYEPANGKPADTDLSRREPLPAGTVRLKGAVDRVEVGDGYFTVIDYKTGSGRIPGPRDVTEGAHVQLPLYLYAVELMLREKGSGQATPGGALIYRVRHPVRLRVSVGDKTLNGVAFDEPRGSRRLLPGADELRQLIARAVKVAEESVNAIARGFFPLVRPGGNVPAGQNRTMASVCRAGEASEESYDNMEEQ